MCVILIASKARPSEDMVKNAWETNEAGGGIAWRGRKEGTEILDGYVHWKKGIMTLDEMQGLCKVTPMPYVAHFRIPSVGGKRPDLCHPFPIEKNVPLDLTGKTKGNLLFHNGHWTRWKDMTMDAAGRFGVPLPTGKWSDTRAMAFMASVFGVGVLEFIDEKAVSFGPSECEVFLGTGWKLINDVFCSNDFFESRGRTQSYYGTGPSRYTQLCVNGTCALEKVSGSQYCQTHKDANDKLQKEAQEARDKRIREAAERQKALNGGGGDHKLLPFHEIERLYKSQARHPSGALIISKNFWKKSRKKFQKDQRLLMKHANKLAKEGLRAQSLVLH
jgi:hypothetical protein